MNLFSTFLFLYFLSFPNSADPAQAPEFGSGYIKDHEPFAILDLGTSVKIDASVKFDEVVFFKPEQGFLVWSIKILHNQYVVPGNCECGDCHIVLKKKNKLYFHENKQPFRPCF